MADAGSDPAEFARWRDRSRAVTITRDEWGIPHVHGGTDADAVFGLMYAQAEDDFARIETNCLVALGRLAEAEGESALMSDLRARLFADHDHLRARHAEAPEWLRVLTVAWADGLNHYLASHPETRPRALDRFEPWMAFASVEGAVLGPVGRVALDGIRRVSHPAAVGGGDDADPARARKETGSNAFAIAPAKSSSGNALLVINPHTDFFFRAEVHLTSDEGLDCYGAVTWGQFFVFQGFNDRLGWGHTTSGADTVDEFVETVTRRGDDWTYRYGIEDRQVVESRVAIRCRAADGVLEDREFPVFRTVHGPVVDIREDGAWITVSLMDKPIEGLSQSFLRMKARTFDEFRRVGEHRANSTVNAVYADAEGTIAYLHPQFMPRRDDRFDYGQPVDGSDPRATWKGEHAVDELPNVVNPRSGWIVNCNDAAYHCAGPDSPREADFPRYMDTSGSNPRTPHAAALLGAITETSLEGLVRTIYDRELTGFARLLPALLAAFDADPGAAEARRVAGQIDVLRAWDRRSSTTSVATTLAVCWVEQLLQDFAPEGRLLSAGHDAMFDMLETGHLGTRVSLRALGEILDVLAEQASPALKLGALATVSGRLDLDFGTWRVPWGEINRYQRLPGPVPVFDDALPSMPVGLASHRWGSLASFQSIRAANTVRRYGRYGNGFVAAVEFGERVRALAISVGGSSGDPDSPHFDDQGSRMTTGDLRPVPFYPEEVAAHARRVYHPGAEASAP